MRLFDVNGDGRVDVMANDHSLSYHSPSVVWYGSFGGQLFGPPRYAVLSLDSAPRQALADFDGDGAQDLVGFGHPNTVQWWANDGAGAWESSPILSQIGFHPEIVLARDLDDDGDVDILVRDGSELEIIEAMGGGQYSLRPLSSWTVGSPVAVPMDLDGDGDDDLVIGSRYGLTTTGPQWFENVGSLRFERRAPVLPAAPSGFHDATLADLDGDGLQDLVFADGRYDVLLVRGADPAATPGFALESEAALLTGRAEGTERLLAIDADGDGDTDVLAYGTSGEVTLAENVATRFRPPAPLDPGMPGSLMGARAADMDQDGDEDLLALTSSSEYGWFANDGTGMFGAFQSIGVTGGRMTPLAIDVKGDGDVDVVIDRGAELVLHEQIAPGVFGPAIVLENVPGTVLELIAVDLDFDGDVDLVSLESAPSVSDRLITRYERTGRLAFERTVRSDEPRVEPQSRG